MVITPPPVITTMFFGVMDILQAWKAPYVTLRQIRIDIYCRCQLPMSVPAAGLYGCCVLLNVMPQ